MMTEIFDVFSGSLLRELALTIFFKASLVLGLAYLLVHRSQKSAAQRHTIWTTALGTLTFLVLLTAIVTPRWSLLPSPESQKDRTTATRPVEPGAQSGVLASSHRELSSSGILEPDHQKKDSTPQTSIAWSTENSAQLALAVYLCGAFLILVRFGRALGSIHRITRSSRPIPRRTRRRLQPLAKRAVPCLVSDRISVPLTWGWFRPVILVPKSSCSWSRARWLAVLLHECAHIERRDYCYRLLQLLACATCWPNPLVWMVALLASREREKACDDRVVSRGMNRIEYAEHLFAIARAASNSEPQGAMGMAGSSFLRDRVRSLLRAHANRNQTRKRSLWILISIGGLLLLPLSSLGLTIPHPDKPKPGTLIHSSSAHIQSLVKRLDHPDSSVRQKSAWVLAELEASGAVGPLMQALADEDPAVRGVVAWALGEIKEPSAIQALSRSLDEDPDPLVREMAARSLGEMEHPMSFLPLLPALQDSNLGVRRAAVWALGDLRDLRAISVLSDILLGSKDEMMRIEAVEALASLPAILSPATFRRALQDESPRVRESIIQAFGEKTLAVPALHRVLLSDQDLKVRNQAAESLARIARKENRELEAVSALTRALFDNDPRVRRNVARLLGEIGSEEAIESLLPLLRDPDQQTRDQVIWSLDEINPSRD